MKKLITTLGLIALIGSRANTNPGGCCRACQSHRWKSAWTDLEAYVTNGARQTNAATALATSPGPGHNAWQMTCAALVLFMTLPGLALFYGGLVRRKNVLSVLAQCLGIAGLVTILWWLCGYSIAFHSGKPFFGGLRLELPARALIPLRTPITAAGFRTTSSPCTN